jgi:hypothetical protein
VSSNFFASRFLPNIAQVGVTDLATDKVVILGDGNVKGTFDYVTLAVQFYLYSRITLLLGLNNRELNHGYILTRLVFVCQKKESL